MSATLLTRVYSWWKSPNRTVKSHRGIPRRGALPAVEALEDRAMPSTANQVFLAAVYQGELRRPIDDGGLAGWTSQLDQNVSRTQVARAILNSDEYFARIIKTDYNALLGRDPDAGGLSSFLQTMRQGATPQDVKTDLLASDEFFSRVGDNTTGFLDALYSEELDRPLDVYGYIGFYKLAGTVEGRTKITQAVDRSAEGSIDAVIAIYQDVLGRVPDVGGLGYWSGLLRNGESQSTVTAGLLGSDEFFGGAQAAAAANIAADPNIVAADFIAQRSLFQTQLKIIVAVPPIGGSSNDDTGDNNVDSSGGDSGGFIDGNNNNGGVIIIPNPPPVDTSGGYTYDPGTDCCSSSGDTGSYDPGSDCCSSGDAGGSYDPGPDCCTGSVDTSWD